MLVACLRLHQNYKFCKETTKVKNKKKILKRKEAKENGCLRLHPKLQVLQRNNKSKK